MFWGYSIDNRTSRDHSVTFSTQFSPFFSNFGQKSRLNRNRKISTLQYAGVNSCTSFSSFFFLHAFFQGN